MSEEKRDTSAPETDNEETKPQASGEDTKAEAKPEAKAEAASTPDKKPNASGPKKPAAKKTKPKDEEALPKEPSPNQPKLDRIAALIRERVSAEAIVETYINEIDRHLPTVIIHPDYWLETARLLRDDEELQLNYLRSVAGVDMETHMEVVYHLLSLTTREQLCFKVKADRDQPSVPSVTPIWETANWNEREIYDLLGIDFPGHPDLRRIMMPDDWIGHPLRKDYEPYDPEV